jgi:hypothetical protein
MKWFNAIRDYWRWLLNDPADEASEEVELSKESELEANEAVQKIETVQKPYPIAGKLRHGKYREEEMWLIIGNCCSLIELNRLLEILTYCAEDYTGDQIIRFTRLIGRRAEFIERHH